MNRQAKKKKKSFKGSLRIPFTNISNLIIMTTKCKFQ